MAEHEPTKPRPQRRRLDVRRHPPRRLDVMAAAIPWPNVALFIVGAVIASSASSPASGSRWPATAPSPPRRVSPSSSRRPSGLPGGPGWTAGPAAVPSRCAAPSARPRRRSDWPPPDRDSWPCATRTSAGSWPVLPVPPAHRPPLPGLRRAPRHQRPAPRRPRRRAVVQRVCRPVDRAARRALDGRGWSAAVRATTTALPLLHRGRLGLLWLVGPAGSSGCCGCCPGCPHSSPDRARRTSPVTLPPCPPCSTTSSPASARTLPRGRLGEPRRPPADERSPRDARRPLDAEAPCGAPGPVAHRRGQAVQPEQGAAGRRSPTRPPSRRVRRGRRHRDQRPHRAAPLRRLPRRPRRGAARPCGSRCCARTSWSSDYQLFEARAHGADLILLIVAALDAGRPGPHAALARRAGHDRPGRGPRRGRDPAGGRRRRHRHRRQRPQPQDPGGRPRHLRQPGARSSPTLVKVAESGIADPATPRRMPREGADASSSGRRWSRGARPGAAHELIAAGAWS